MMPVMNFGIHEEGYKMLKEMTEALSGMRMLSLWLIAAAMGKEKGTLAQTKSKKVDIGKLQTTPPEFIAAMIAIAGDKHLSSLREVLSTVEAYAGSGVYHLYAEFKKHKEQIVEEMAFQIINRLST